MSVNTSATLSQQYQAWRNKQLLSYIVQELRLNEFAQQVDLPKNAGSKTVDFFKYGAPASSNVQTLVEGTTPGTTRDLTMTTLTATLVQYGEVMELTDILGATDLFNALKNGIKLLGQDAALKADDLSRNELVSNGTKFYAQGASNYTTLSAAAVASAKWLATDGLDICTRLKINRGPKIGGAYVGVLPPQISRDVQNDPDWKTTNQYAGGTAIFKGELGMLGGIRYVEATNPFIESSAGSEGTYDAAGDVFSTIYLAGEAFGVVKMQGDRPMSPSVHVVKGASKSDPLDQKTKAGWKAFWTTKSLQTDWYRIYKSKSAFAA